MQPGRRVYDKVAVLPGADGFGVTLDGRPVRTPAGEVLAVPSGELAAAIAEEWAAQGERIVPQTLPLFRLCATAIDRARADRGAFIRGIVAYGPTDLCCYRAAGPQDLVARQVAQWQPLLDWAREAFGTAFAVTTGVVPVAQTDDLEVRLSEVVGQLDDFCLAALASATAACGSVVIGLALLCGRLDAETAFEAAMLDELYQAAKWGEDPEAAERRDGLRAEITTAAWLAGLATARGRPLRDLLMVETGGDQA